jgi:hypothetical protein
MLRVRVPVFLKKREDPPFIKEGPSLELQLSESSSPSFSAFLSRLEDRRGGRRRAVGWALRRALLPKVQKKGLNLLPESRPITKKEKG